MTLAMEFPVPSVELEAHVFTLTEVDGGAVVGRSVVCLDARYISAALAGAPRLVRSFASGSEWLAIEKALPELRVGDLVDRRSVLGDLIVRELGTSPDVRFTQAFTLTCTAGETTSKLDAVARAESSIP